MEQQLRQYFKANHIRTEEVARKTGYSINYVRNLLNGSDALNDKARFRFIIAFPGTRAFLLPEATDKTVETNDEICILAR